MKKEKYISEDERGGVKVAKVNLPLSRGERRLVRGRTSCVGEEKTNKRGRIIGEGSFTAQEGGAQQNYAPPFGGVPASPSYHGGEPMQALGSDAAIPPIKFCGAQRSLCGAICTSSSTTTKCGHHWRIRCKKHANYCSHPNQCKPNG
jgi:hypothetical protein